MVGLGLTAAPAPAFTLTLPTVCVVCKLRPVFSVLLRTADTLRSGDLAF